MLIAPIIKAMVDKYPVPTTNPKLYRLNAIPEHLSEIDIKLAENQSIVYIKLHNQGWVEVIERFRLTSFSVSNGTARWMFMSSAGQSIEGAFNATTLINRLSVKLIMPILILQSRNGLRTTFRFRVDPEYRVLTAPRFKELTKGG